MANVARGKPVVEQMTSPEIVTNGVVTDYAIDKGFAWFVWPGTLTVDLGEPIILKGIRFLLWDNLGKPENARSPREYQYRLLVSDDRQKWTVLYDTSRHGYNGWQGFQIPNGVRARYIRLHGLTNTANEQFHVVELEAYDDQLPTMDVDYVLWRPVAPEDTANTEIGEGVELTKRLGDIVDKLEHEILADQHLRIEPFQKLFDQLRFYVGDLSAIEGHMDSIRRQVMSPLTTDLQGINKASRWSLWVGVGGGLLAIVSLLLNLLRSN